jgi:hypothetical protein
MSTVKTNAIEPASGGTVTITGAALTTPALGTPASGTLTNCTGLPASAVVNTPAGGISATTVQAAINELGTEKANLSGASFTGAISVNHAMAASTSADLINTSATGYGLFSRGGGGPNYAALFVDYSAGVTLATLSGGGDWTVAGEASFAATNCRIASNGNVTNLNGVYGTISERRFKNVLGLTTPKLQKILQLSALVCNYTLKDDPEQIKQIGLIVDEVEAISPGLIFTEPVFEPVSVTRTIQRQRTETKTVQRQVITVQNGRAVMTSESVSVNEPVFGSVPVFDEHGQPVLDGDGRQLVHSFPVMEDVEETYTELRDLGNVRKGIKWSVVVPMLLRAFGDLHGDFDARIKAMEGA